MRAQKSKNDRLLLWGIIAISLIGNVYFAYRAISANRRTAEVNPYEYSVESFKVFDPALLSHSETMQIPLCFEDVYGIAVDDDGYIYVSGDGTILIMDNEGETKSSFKTDKTALSIDVSPDGLIYLGMSGQIDLYSSAGAMISRWDAPDEESLFTSVKVAGEFVYAADAGKRIVRKFDANWNEVLEIAKKDESKDIPGCIIPGRFFDVDVDSDSFLWVVNPGRHSLENYTPEGDIRTSWGDYSMKIEGFCGCCNPSHISILEDGSFITSEKGIPRVKVYNRHGGLESVVAGPDQFLEGTEGLDIATDSYGRVYILDPMKMAVRIFEKISPGV